MFLSTIVDKYKNPARLSNTREDIIIDIFKIFTGLYL